MNSEPNIWEVTQDRINCDEGVPLIEKMRRAKTLQEMNTSPETQKLIARVKRLSAMKKPFIVV